MTPIRKGLNPVKIPFPIKVSDRTLASWCHEVRTALQQIEGRIPTVSNRPPSSASRPPLWTAISQVPADPGTYQVTVTLGYLTYQNAGASEATQGVTGYIAPKINGVALDDEDVEPLELPDVVSFTYLRVKTTADGMPKFDDEDGPVTIESFPEAQKSVHHVRPSPTSGEEEGDYYFLILETESNGATPPAPIAKRRITGNRELPNQLVEITNIGGEREWYQGYLVGPDDKHELRTAEQILPASAEDAAPEEEADSGHFSTAIPIIKPLDEAIEAVEPVVDGDGKIITKGTPAVPAEEEGDTIKWRFLTQRSTAPQVNVQSTAGGGGVLIKGNDYSENFPGLIKNLTVDDGLVTGFEDAGGASYNVELLAVSLVVQGGGGIGVDLIGSPLMWYIRNGLHVEVDDGAAVGTYRVISQIDNYGASPADSGDSGERYVAP